LHVQKAAGQNELGLDNTTSYQARTQQVTGFSACHSSSAYMPSCFIFLLVMLLVTEQFYANFFMYQVCLMHEVYILSHHNILHKGQIKPYLQQVE